MHFRILVFALMSLLGALASTAQDVPFWKPEYLINHKLIHKDDDLSVFFYFDEDNTVCTTIFHNDPPPRRVAPIYLWRIDRERLVIFDNLEGLGENIVFDLTLVARENGRMTVRTRNGKIWIFSDEFKPNQALVPTPASVTPAADAPVAPDAGAAHL
jgi:hypothetical protein